MRHQPNRNDKWFLRSKTQVILGFIFAFMATMLLTLGIVRIWVWFNANYAHRELAYQRSRLKAGQPDIYQDIEPDVERFLSAEGAGATPEFIDWVERKTLIDIGGEDIGLDTGGPDAVKYRPMNLTEEWVFEGLVPESISLTGRRAMTPEERQQYCQEECVDDEECIVTSLGETVFDPSCTCFTRCLCLGMLEEETAYMDIQIQNFNQRADQMDDLADSMHDQADDCDDPWETCWWGDFFGDTFLFFGNWGGTARELDQAANEVEIAAAQLRQSAADIAAQKAEIEQCCDHPTYKLQSDCMNLASADAECEFDCFRECGPQCNYTRDDGNYEACHSGCYSYCNNICVGGTSTCSDLVNNQFNSINDLINRLNAEQAKLSSGIAQIEARISECADWADTTCDNECFNSADFEECHKACYAEKRVFCCGAVCCLESASAINCYYSDCRLESGCDQEARQYCNDTCIDRCADEEEGGCFATCFEPCLEAERGIRDCYEQEFSTLAWGSCPCGAYERDCEETGPPCDEDCYGLITCPSCSLVELTKRLNIRIDEIDAMIAVLNEKRDSIDVCCETETYPGLWDQMNCLEAILSEE